jgi:restriction system protein
MSRRRKKQSESLVDSLMGAPWQVSMIVAAAVFIGMKWILPALAGGNVLLKPMSQAVSGFAWLFSGFFFLIGVFVYLKEKKSNAPGFASSTKDSTRTLRTGVGYATNKSITPIERLEPSSSTDQAIEPIESANGYLSSTPLNGAGTLPTNNSLPIKPSAWSIELIREIEWKRFEDVCQKFYELKGIRSETTALGPDGGIDIRLYQDDSGKATSIVQCKAWGERFVGVKPVRELLGVMTHEKIAKAFFMTSGRYSDEAKEVAKSNRITLMDGDMLLMMFKRLPETDQQKLLEFATAGDYKTPSCPNCGVKMKAVAGKSGRPDFWGCTQYPRCRQTLGKRRDVYSNVCRRRQGTAPPRRRFRFCAVFCRHRRYRAPRRANSCRISSLRRCRVFQVADWPRASTLAGKRVLYDCDHRHGPWRSAKFHAN